MNPSRTITYSVILLAIIIGFSIFTTRSLASTSEKLQNHITEIESNTQNENWEKAEDLLNTVEKTWAGTEKTWSTLLDHIEIDNIDTALKRMSKFVESRDKSSALAEAAVLKQLIGHIPQKESFNLKNIF